MFLGINVDRNGCITKENLRFLCEKLHLPSSNDIIDAVSYLALFINFTMFSNTLHHPNILEKITLIILSCFFVARMCNRQRS